MEFETMRTLPNCYVLRSNYYLFLFLPSCSVAHASGESAPKN